MKTDFENGVVYHGDSLDIMHNFKEQGIKFDLCLTDPPYGIGESNKKNLSRFRKNDKIGTAYTIDYPEFADKIPDKTYFDLIIEISKNQIIWGGGITLQIIFQ